MSHTDLQTGNSTVKKTTKKKNGEKIEYKKAPRFCGQAHT